MAGEPYGARVRLRYATFVNIATRMIAVFASLIFVISVTRRLSVEEFGIWSMIMKYVNYTLPFTSIYAYWLPRTISRGVNTARTGFIMSILLGLTASIIYTGIAYEASAVFNQPIVPLLVAVLIVFQEYLNRCLTAISIGHAPQYVGWSTLILRISQAILGVFLVLFYKWGLYGAVLAAVGGRSAVLILLFVLNSRFVMESKFEVRVLWDWLKKSWLPLYSGLLTSFIALDAIIVRYFTGGEEPVAYYGVAISLLGLTLASTQGLPALYSRLLANRRVEDIVEVFWILFMITTPTVIGVLCYAEAFAAIYNIAYVQASLVIRVFAIAAFFRLFSMMLETALKGVENRDIGSTGFNDLLGTALFKTPSINYFITSIYLVLLALSSILLGNEYVTVALAWGVLYTIRQVLLSVSFALFLKKEFSILIPYGKLLKYSLKFMLASITIILVRILCPVEPVESIYTLLRELLPAIACSAVSYLGALIVLDSKFRELVRRIISSIIL